MMTDELFRSMKAQMEPSDDVVSSLLAAISAEAASPVDAPDNVVSFEEALNKRFTPIETAAKTKKTKKSIWYYSTAVAASVIVLFSSFLLLNPSGDIGSTSPSSVKDLFTNIIKDSGTEDLNDGENSGTEDDINTDDKNSDDTTEKKGILDRIFGKDKDDEKSNNDSSNNPTDTDSQGGDANDWQTPTNHDTPTHPGNTDEGENDSQNPGSSQPDDSKITPGLEGAGDIAWTNEIVRSDSVASLTISGNNYVVQTTGSGSDVGATIETVTVDLPQTSSTNAATVKAKVRMLRNVSAVAMVALDVEGFSEPLIYTNPDYSPSNLGGFISDLGLEGNTSFAKSVVGRIAYVGYTSTKNYSKDINDAAWSYLLSNGSAGLASYSSYTNGGTILLFKSNSNPTGSALQFGVSSNGYLYVKMSSGKNFTFHIGVSNAESFIEYVTGEKMQSRKSDDKVENKIAAE